MTGNTLWFVHGDRPPATDGVRVFDSLTRSFLGAEFTFRVIGSSHYVSAPAYDFYELSTCAPTPAIRRAGTAIALAPNRPPRRLAFETEHLRCETVVEHRPLSAFRRERGRGRARGGDSEGGRPRDRDRTNAATDGGTDDRPADLAVAFDGDPEAVTTISIDDRDGAYETYHTYPEFDLALYTRTTFTPVRGATGRERRTRDAPCRDRTSTAVSNRI